jgi:ParB-like chromosome segregation protein Spo0J
VKIEKKKIDELIASDYNPRKDIHDLETYEALKNSIEEFGLVEPIVFNERTGRIVGGHQRVSVLKDLGWEEVEVSIVDLSDEEEKILNIGLNKISGEWDIERLKDVLLEIDVGEANVELTGFSLDEIEGMMTRTYQEFDHEELDLEEFEDEKFKYCCPNCEFHFNK